MARNSFYTGSVANAIAIDTSAEEAAASATAAAASASTAATQASNAATSATSSAASYDSFDDRYLGAKSSAPSTDNDSNALIEGALYWNSSSDNMFAWDGSAWAEIKPTSSDQTKINTVSGIQANVTTVAGISSDVTTVAGISSDVAAVENIAANVTSVAGIASNVTSVAGNATNINAVAGNATNINAATTKAAEAATSATASSNSATAAASSASTASTQAGIATAKAVLTAADAVSTAADVVSSAANAASAAATYDSFDDRYLGSKSSAPTVDNDGNALVVGALYYDSTGSVMKVYTASGWIATSSATLATMERFVFTATANQTVFTGNDAGGDTLAIVVGAEMVTLNGVVLEVTVDYTVTTSTVTLTSGAAANDELNVYAFGNFEIANHYTKAAADALYDAKASLTGAAFTGAITTNSTFDGVDIATRDGVLTSTTTTANAALPKSGGAMTGAITTNSTFDGRDVGTDGTKLDGIEASATADQTNAEIRTAVEAASDSNVFTDSDHSKLNAIEANATADQTNAEIRTAVEAASDSNVFTDADHTKLNAIEASADVTDATNVTAAGALMDSEITNLAAVKAFDASDYATAAQGTLATNALPKAGGALTGAVTTNSTFDGVDVAACNTTANAALPKAGGTLTGAVVGATDTDASNSGTVDLDFTNNTNFVLTLTGNITSLTASNEVAGQSGFIVFIQDGTGSRTVALHGDYETAGGAGLTLTSTASATDIVPYVVAASSRILLGAPQLAFA